MFRHLCNKFTFKIKVLHLVDNLQQVEHLLPFTAILTANTVLTYSYLAVAGDTFLLLGPSPCITLMARVENYLTNHTRPKSHR